MTISAIVTGIIALAKAVPIVERMAMLFVYEWKKALVNKNRAEIAEMDRKRDIIIAQTKKATTNEDRRALAKTLNNLN